MSMKLDTVDGHRVWKVNGKKTKVLNAHQTARARGTKFKLSYKLQGGTVKARVADDNLSWSHFYVPGEIWYVLQFRPVGGGEAVYSICLQNGMEKTTNILKPGKEYICDISYDYGEDFEWDEIGEWYLPRRIYVQP